MASSSRSAPASAHLPSTAVRGILPVLIRGTHAALPKGAILPRPGHFQVRIGSPLSIDLLRHETQGLPRLQAFRQVAARAEAAVRALDVRHRSGEAAGCRKPAPTVAPTTRPTLAPSSGGPRGAELRPGTLGAIVMGRPTVLVTGGTGFLGRSVVQELRKRGAVVRTLSRRAPNPTGTSM